MADHEEMRNAIDRAVENFKINECNFCKTPFIQDGGYFSEIQLMHKFVRIWECADCVETLGFKNK